MKAKNIAVISLCIMGAGFLITLFLSKNSVVLLLRGGFEAGLVGGIADWFAVTALFRHPFGIPIPHTSLLLKNRDKIINALISAMENEFLNKESITRRLKQVKLLDLLSGMAVKMIRKRKSRTGIVAFVRSFAEQLPLEKLVPIIQTNVSSYLRHADLKPFMDTIIREIDHKGLDEKALDYALMQGSRWAAKRETEQWLGRLAHQKMKEMQVGGLMGFAVQAFAGFMTEEKLGSTLQNMLVSGIFELSRKDSSYRSQLLQQLKDRMQSLIEDEAMLNLVKSWLANKAEEPDAGKFLLERLQEIRSRILHALDKDQQKGGRLVVTVFRFGVTKLQGQGELTAEWERSLMSFIEDVIEANHFRIGVLVKQNLDQLDDRALVQMLEQKVGSDLQWIRVNGAICGFIIGILLTLLSGGVF